MFFNRPTTGSFNTYGAGAWNETKEEEETFDGRMEFAPKNKIVDIEGAERNIEGAPSQSGDGQSEAPTTNPAADRARNQQSNMTALMQQHGNKLDPMGAGVLSAAAGLALSDGKPIPALVAGVGGYALAKHFQGQGQGQADNQSFDPRQAVEGTPQIQPAPQITRDEQFTQSEAVSQEKADISGMYPNQSEGGLEFAPKLADADTNRANAFSDPITMLAQSAKTTTEDDFNPAFNSNMQPQIGGESGLELPAPGGQPGNVPNPADELITSFTKGRVPSYLARTLGGGSVV